ncbi:MAG: amidohydrolase family protein [Acidobacteria bacterium]|nr:amidohydrolase family protein [Acidobacteriota bacterium]
MRSPLRIGAVTLALALTGLTTRGVAQRAPIGAAIREFVSIDAPVVALTNARVIDGTGAAARDGQTLVLRDGRIAAVGPSATTPAPDGARVVDLAGKSVLPGLVMLHEHLYYPTGPGVYGQLGQSFVRLYLAGGVTTMRTGGNLNGFMDITLKRRVEAGEAAGPSIDATMPYVNGPNQFVQMTDLRTEERARRHVAYWAEEGATSVKAYMQVSRAALGTAIREAHARGLKVTGHLCSVTYAEAAALGIDNLEHGFFAATDFVPGKKPDECPGQGRGQQTVADIDPQGVAFQTLIRTLIEKKVAVTSTLTVFELNTPGRPLPPGLDVIVPQLREQFLQNRARVEGNAQSIYPRLFPKAMALEREFVRAGGLLVAGTDPTGGGGVIPGYANQRQLELLVEAGFTPLEAITIGTRNGARYLGLEKRLGTIAPGLQADLMVVAGDPSRDITALRNVETVFRQGVGFDSARLIQSVAGKVGLW